MATILPCIAVNATRLCDGDDDVNCFLDLKGCNTTNMSDSGLTIGCDDAAGWSVSLAFIGTGVSLSTGSTCSEDTCKWTVDGAEGCTQWFYGETGGQGVTTYFRAMGLDGEDDTRHTLVISSTGSNSTDAPRLRFYNGTRIYTGPDTPVHPGDYIAISPHYSEVQVEGEWSALKNQQFKMHRDLVGGEGSISVGIVGDAFQMGWAFGFDAPGGMIEDDDKPTVNRIINGEEIEDTDGGLIPLDPGGWYNVGMKASFDTNSPVQYVTAYEVIYHPLDNITRIRDIIPEALVGSFNESPPQSNELGCSASESGAVSHLRESTGATFLLPVFFILYALRLKF